MQNAQRLDILLPEIIEKFDVVCLAHGSPKGFDEVTRDVVGRCSFASLCAQHPGAQMRVLVRLPDSRGPHFSHAGLLTIVKSKPEGVAKGGKRALGSIGLGAFKR